MSKLRSADWWFGRTPEQQARKQRWQTQLDKLDRVSEGAESASQKMNSAGKGMMKGGLKLTLYVTIPIVLLVLLLLLLA